MRICFFEGDMSRPGGTERMTAWLANALSRRADVSVVSLRQASDELFFPLEEAVRYAVVPAQTGKLGIVKQIRWFRRYIQKNCIDWVVNVDVGMGFYGILAARGTGARVITWEHGNYFNNWGSRLFPYMRRYAAKHSDAVVVLTQRDRDNYIRHIPGCAPVQVIPNPVTPCEPAFDPRSRTILSIGHLVPNKGFHRAVEIAAMILKDRPEWRWVICGEGPERRNLEAMIRAEGLQDSVLLPGLVKDLKEVYRKAAMLVMTSDLEGLPMVLLEGKAHGLPLAAFDIMTGPSEIIRDGADGFLIEPFCLETMARKISELMDCEQLRVRMSGNALWDLERFSEESVLHAWESLLDQFTCGSPGKDGVDNHRF